jgi:NAD dependent epimerase/dehydratase family enzyme
VTADWEAEARRAEELGVRVVVNRTGVVLSPSGGALEKMMPFFKLGIGGPVAAASSTCRGFTSTTWSARSCSSSTPRQRAARSTVTAPEPATNRDLSKALGRVLHRPAIAPVPALAVKALYGEMAEIVTTGQRAVPARLTELGYAFRRPELEDALRDATGSRP